MKYGPKREIESAKKVQREQLEDLSQTDENLELEKTKSLTEQKKIFSVKNVSTLQKYSSGPDNVSWQLQLMS